METRLSLLLVACVFILLEGFLQDFGYELTSTESLLLLSIGSAFGLAGIAAYLLEHRSRIRS